MIVLDTNVISELMKSGADRVVGDWLNGLGTTMLATTSITVFEIEYGLRRLPQGRRREDLQARFEDFIVSLPVLPLDDVSAREGGHLRAMREAGGLSAHASDMMIAGITRVAGAALATRNGKDFDGLPLQIIDPWRAH